MTALLADLKRFLATVEAIEAKYRNWSEGNVCDLLRGNDQGHVEMAAFVREQLATLIERHEPRTLATDSVAFAELFKASMGPVKVEPVADAAEMDDNELVNVDELFAA